MENIEIGKLIIMKYNKWESLKNKYQSVALEMEYAVVKDLEDEKSVLVDENILNLILNYGQN